MSFITFNADPLGNLTQSDAGGITITYTTSGSLTGFFTGNTYPGPLIIPSILGGVTVTSIEDWAFRYNATLVTSVTIPNSVTSIASNAFTGSGLTSALVSVDQLGTTTFPSTTGTGQTIGGKDGVTINTYTEFIATSSTDLSDATFQLGGATTAVIVGYTSIGYYAFANAQSLTSITIPASITSIGDLAFQGASNLTSVTFEAGSQLTSIGQYAFSSTSLTSITIPSSVTSIGYGAFNGATSLTSVTFAQGSQLTSIGSNAFLNASKLTSITIPSSVTSIGYGAFNSSGLTTMYVSRTNGLGLTPSTPMPLYGAYFTIIAPPAAPPAIPICFLASTTVTTDQGDTAIEKLRHNFHTIRGKKIVSIVTVHPLQKLMYKGKIVKAIDLVEGYQEPTTPPPHLYLVRLRDSRKGRR